MKDDFTTQGAGSDIAIQLLGGFSVSIGGAAVAKEKWRSRRVRSLVKLLSLSPGHRMHREQVIDQLWPESDFSAAANNLHQSLFAARQVLDAEAPGWFVLDDGFLSLFCGEASELSVDVEQFEAAALRAKNSSSVEAVQAALALYPGDLLPDDLYEEWTIQRRDGLRLLSTQLLFDLAGLFEARAEYSQGIETLKRLLAADRSHEEAHAALMRLYALSGQRQQALRQYQSLREALRDEFDTEPGTAAQQVYQSIQTGELTAAAPPDTARETGSPAHNVPVQLTSFIGREKELKEIFALLISHRLVTLNGSGGTGKTRLAVQVMTSTLSRFPDGVWFVDLAPLANPETISKTIAIVFHIKENIEQDSRSLLVNALREKHLLLVLDNCEHMLDACAGLVNDLLLACPNLTVLTTSREALGIAGEATYRVPSLAVPDPGAVIPLDELVQYDAVHLFAERASTVVPDFQLSPLNVQAVVRICDRLNGIPLAIELAAARVRVLSVEEINSLLDDRFRLLTGGSRMALPRQRTLRASIDWSYDLLSDPEKALLQRLSVFYGGCTLEAAEAVCSLSGLEKIEILDLLSSLVSKSLVIADQQPPTATRYRMLETIRQYAQEKLVDVGDPAELHDRHLTYFLGLVEEMEPHLKSVRAPVLLSQLDLELDNLRAALNWASGKNTQAGYEQELRLFNGLWQFWASRGLITEGIEWGSLAVDHNTPQERRSIEIQARACFFLGHLYLDHICLGAEWKKYLDESIRLYRQTTNRQGMALSLAFLRRAGFVVEFFQGPLPGFDPFSAEAMKKESLEVVNAISSTAPPEDLWIKAVVLLLIGEFGNDGEHYPDAQNPMIEEAIALFAALGDQVGEIWGSTALGDIAAKHRDWMPASTHYLHALDIAQMLKSKNDMISCFGALGAIAYRTQNYGDMEMYFEQAQKLDADLIGERQNPWFPRMRATALLHQGDTLRARDLLLEDLDLTQNYSDSYGLLSALVGLAGVAAQCGDSGRAVKLLAFFDKQMETFFKRPDEADLQEIEWHLTTTRQQLEPFAFRAFWDEGQRMTLDQAVAEAARETCPAGG